MIEVARGDSPLVLGLPHTGTQIPGDVLSRLNAMGRAMADTDWHIDRLYDGLVADITTVRTPIHRYVIDVNRDPTDISLYPGQNTTSLCPLTDFNGAPIYRAGREPNAEEIIRRREAYHAPYHAALTAELERLRAVHGFAILYDCHSIRSHIPFLFDGALPDFNIGTNNGTTCAPELEQHVQEICASATGYSHVLNGRFKGGWTTRRYGRPEEGLHAIQMELAQSTYMAEAAPWTWSQDKADRLRRPLASILTTLKNWSPA
ncbi:N-formylglutamate deformylase [Ruegeria jejuensis]|uniref:N-formylglutamate deformylase n=1 Tax=Ruegeria jejuensis TaxID=3233338 RepID=UPI00355AECA3